jgi:hypothetical protein
MFRLASRIAGALAIVAVFFFGTLFILDRLDTLEFPDSERANHARSVKAALEVYRRAQGHYPVPFTDNPLVDLKKELVDGKFLGAIPQDPLWGLTENQYRYVSYDGKIYGLLFHLQFPVGKIPAGGSCLTGIGSETTGWYRNAPPCPF